MQRLSAFIEAPALWAPTLPDWATARAVFRGETPPAQPPRPVPAPASLPPAERRRAPKTVALSLAAAEASVHASGRDPSSLLAVFACAHGDLPVIDEICRTLVHTPTLLSPTRFLHSIHNAPAGIWSQLAHNAHANTAVSGAACSFAHGLMEALVQCEAEQCPVLLVAYDTAAVGALTHTTACDSMLSIALILSPQAGVNTIARMDWSLGTAVDCPPSIAPGWAHALSRQAMAPALPLLDALARQQATHIAWPLSPHRSLQTGITPIPAP